MPHKVVDSTRSYIYHEPKMLSHHSSVLNVPRWPPLADFRLPAQVAFPATVPENEVAPVPRSSGIGVLMEAPLLLGPLAHVEPCEFAETREFQGVKIRIHRFAVLMPVGVVFLHERANHLCRLVYNR